MVLGRVPIPVTIEYATFGVPAASKVDSSITLANALGAFLSINEYTAPMHW